MATKVLVVEDEVKIAQILVDFLALDGFEVTTIHDGADAVLKIKNQQPDFVILDLMLPNKDGLSICKEVRQFSNVPILMLTARVDEIDRLMGLEFGADDYVCKPFLPREVVARVKTILRRTAVIPATANDEEVTKYKVILLNLSRFQCQIAGVEVELTPVEFRLLNTLITRPGIVHSRDSLMQVCYLDDRIVSARTIDSHIKNLRNKLSQQGQEALLHSIYGIGYKIE